ncbi:MAG: hypothetical protein SF187_23580 [Deltaproteobacteria bacterium]|nr:hypothetical protein [Deltaproteobacteria bacterium]
MCKRWKAMECAFERSVAGAAAQSWKSLVDAEPELLGYEDGKALLNHLHGQMGSDAERDRILSALVQASRVRSPSGHLARDLIWLALWPGLTALRRRLAGWGAEDEDELSAQIAMTFTEVLARLAPTTSTKVAATLLWNTRKYVSRLLHESVVARGTEVSVTTEKIMSASDTAGCDWTEFISDLVAQAGPDAELVLACVVEGLTVREAATRCQLPAEAIKKRMQRVMRRLRANVSANFAQSDVPFSAEKELIGGERRKRLGPDQREEVGERARAAQPEARHVLEKQMAPVDKAQARKTRPALHTRRRIRSHLRHLRRLGGACRALRKTKDADAMKTMTLPVAVLVAPANERSLSGAEKVVAYCDVCRRWGERGSLHVCGENWSEHLLSVLAITGQSTAAPTTRRPQ